MLLSMLKQTWSIKEDTLFIYPIPKKNKKNGIRIKYKKNREVDEIYTDIIKNKIDYKLPDNHKSWLEIISISLNGNLYFFINNLKVKFLNKFVKVKK